MLLFRWRVGRLVSSPMTTTRDLLEALNRPLLPSTLQQLQGFLLQILNLWLRPLSKLSWKLKVSILSSPCVHSNSDFSTFWIHFPFYCLPGSNILIRFLFWFSAEGGRSGSWPRTPAGPVPAAGLDRVLTNANFSMEIETTANARGWFDSHR